MVPIMCGDVNSSGGIARISGDVPYSEFFHKYMANNIPCIFEESVTKSWLSRKLWVKDELPNFEYLRENFGETIAPVANCNENYFGSQKKTDMSISDFLRYWEEFISKNYPADMPVLYLKDWHMKRNYQGSNYYQVPSYFTSDWLNEFWTQRGDVCDDYRFVYMGPQGSWTPKHEDVFSSYSWSANIVGKKRWVFYPPAQYKNAEVSCEQCLMGRLDSMRAEKEQSIEVIQEAGEIIFVPSGWKHEVWNLKDTISINHNWANGCNLESWVWPSLSTALTAVEAELKDCLEDGMECWEEQCQLLLHATHGMDFMEFYSLLSTIGAPRVHFLQCHTRYLDVRASDQMQSESDGVDASNMDISRPCLVTEQWPSMEAIGQLPREIIELEFPDEKNTETVSSSGVVEGMRFMPFSEYGHSLGVLHIVFDLLCIRRVMQNLLSHPSVPKLEFFQKKMASQPHLAFMYRLQMLLQHTGASGDFKVLQRFV
ncbi:2-oxoglutarate and iron-dependent oxygenase JMJD4 [Hetaerina americana]|uniref:2-oxoglutarate and iron-dependent oxygenase JMJD4 n=1 Tax=Hetaerina americana TaxID=62018 RepID=UPI003A7F3390